MMTNSDNALYDSRLEYLLNRYVAQSISPEEREELFSIAAEQGNETLLATAVEKIMRMPDSSGHELPANSSQEILDTILASEPLITHTVRKPVVPLSTRWWVAASVLFILALGAYFLQNAQSPATAPSYKTAAVHDIDPGKEGAILTLADGTQVVLDSLPDGIVTLQNGTKVLLKDSQLSYTSGNNKNSEIFYNTISTPRGRQFRLVLPDGTRVWLNASSSLTYPTAFNNNDRHVEVSGEAFFEVATDVQQPFKVLINKQVNVDVLGTTFNVNAYTNESAIYTTLLEGSVRISLESPGATPAVLIPGQQAKSEQKQAGSGASISVVTHPDINRTIAWKRGFFNLEDASVPEVMRMLERWYDIDVTYAGKVPAIRFGGEISKNMKLSGILKALRDMEVNFTVEGDRHIVIQAAK